MYLFQIFFLFLLANETLLQKYGNCWLQMKFFNGVEKHVKPVK